MKASNAAVAPEKGGGLETVRVVTETLRLVTDKRCELYNLTEKVAEVLKRHDIKEGMVLLSSLHTTLALFVNEWQTALLHATLLGHALSFSVSKGKLVLGQFQAIIAAELDGPRNRDLAIQIIGR